MEKAPVLISSWSRAAAALAPSVLRAMMIYRKLNWQDRFTERLKEKTIFGRICCGVENLTVFQRSMILSRALPFQSHLPISPI
jgi:hypothetical protein